MCFKNNNFIVLICYPKLISLCVNNLLQNEINIELSVISLKYVKHLVLNIPSPKPETS